MDKKVQLVLKVPAETREAFKRISERNGRPMCRQFELLVKAMVEREGKKGS